MKKRGVADAASIYQTAGGFGVVAAGDGGLVAHHLPFGAASHEDAREILAKFHPGVTGENALTGAAAATLTRYFAGEQVRFDLPLDLGGFTDFQKSVYRVVAGIGYGSVLSYAEVASLCGSPRGARAIGGAMARNVMPILIPCHRVVGAGGLMTGFTAPGGVASKRDLLAMEGVLLDPRGGILKAA